MIYLLHISDLHLLEDPNANNMVEAILDHVKEKLVDVSRDNRLLVITGDFHNYGEKDYEITLSFLNRLIKCMDLNREQDIFMIPGNHDIDESAANDTNRQNAIYLLRNKPEQLSKQLKSLNFESSYEAYIGFQEDLQVYDKDAIEDKLPIKTPCS